MKAILKFLKWIFPYVLMIGFGIIIYYYISISIQNNLDYYSSIINGIISGIVTALILFVFQVIWKKNVLIWIENMLYQDVCIEGEWSGFLVPYMGLDDLDKISKDIAWRRFREMVKRDRQKDTSSNKNETVEASIIDEKTGKEEKISAEVLLPTKDEKDEKTSDKNNGPKRIVVNLSPTPIVVRLEIKRVGHKINAKMLEIGGASNVCSYTINGTFKNLILSAVYETTNKDNIDRGALSLMLFDNGKRLEGFFSSYSDGSHKVVPMQCVLKKRNQLNDDKE